MRYIALVLSILILCLSCTSTEAFVSPSFSAQDVSVEEKLLSVGGVPVSVPNPEIFFDGALWLERFTELVEEADCGLVAHNDSLFYCVRGDCGFVFPFLGAILSIAFAGHLGFFGSSFGDGLVPLSFLEGNYDQEESFHGIYDLVEGRPGQSCALDGHYRLACVVGCGVPGVCHLRAFSDIRGTGVGHCLPLGGADGALASVEETIHFDRTSVLPEFAFAGYACGIFR